MPIAITQPTTVPEFRRIASAFLSGSRFPTGTPVYIVTTTTGLRPINKIIRADDPRVEEEVSAALANPPAWFTSEDRAHQVTYLVNVPEVDRLNAFLPTDHGATFCSPLSLRTDSAAPPRGATLGDIKSARLTITWNNRTTSSYDLPETADAIFLTRGAAELFCLSAYECIYGDDYVQDFKDAVLSQRA